MNAFSVNNNAFMYSSFEEEVNTDFGDVAAAREYTTEKREDVKLAKKVTSEILSHFQDFVTLAKIYDFEEQPTNNSEEPFRFKYNFYAENETNFQGQWMSMQSKKTSSIIRSCMESFRVIFLGESPDTKELDAKIKLITQDYLPIWLGVCSQKCDKDFALKMKNLFGQIEEFRKERERYQVTSKYQRKIFYASLTLILLPTIKSNRVLTICAIAVASFAFLTLFTNYGIFLFKQSGQLNSLKINFISATKEQYKSFCNN